MTKCLNVLLQHFTLASGQDVTRVKAYRAKQRLALSTVAFSVL